MARIIAETDRLVLRELEEGDAEAFLLLTTDPRVTRFIPVPPLRDLEHARETIRSRRQTDYAERGYGRWACVLKETGSLAGWSGPRFLVEIGEPELGYRFFPEHWGKGLATEAGRAVLAKWFGEMGQRRLVALIDPENLASAGVARKLGFAIEGKTAISGVVVDRWAKEA
ncbi:MAG: GNAT family N-acetyltransferase [Gemmataceae bacterium]|nr:GNAT family N-acetyltransferase [Gemmataceae bacterium]